MDSRNLKVGRKRKRAPKAKDVNPGVLYSKSLAEWMKAATGDCDALAQAAADFKQTHLAEFESLTSREDQLDAESQKAVAEKFQTRITQAT